MYLVSHIARIRRDINKAVQVISLDRNMDNIRKNFAMEVKPIFVYRVIMAIRCAKLLKKLFSSLKVMIRDTEILRTDILTDVPTF